MRRTTRFLRMAASLIVILSVGGVVWLAAAEEAEDATPKSQEHPASFPLSTSGEWSMERLLALDYDEVLALWKTLPAVDMAELNGHYQGIVPNGGDSERQKGLADFMYNEGSDRGYWLGKAYKPLTATTGEGYNRWRFPGGKIVRNLRFGTKMGESLIDGKPAFLMNYGDFNDTTLIDEIRKLDDYVYLGMGTTETEDGKRSTPGHFALVGPTDEWIGAGDS